MKHFPFPRFLSASLCWVATAPLLAQGDPHAAWQKVQAVQVSAPGLVRFEVPLGTIDSSLPRLDDVRLVSPSGVETPYVLEWPRFETVQTRPVAAFRVVLGGHSTVLELDPGTDEAIRAVTLDTTAASFIKAATIEGSVDTAQWQSLAVDELLFRQGNGASRLRIPFTAGKWKHLRVTINDARSDAVAFTGAGIELEHPATPVVAMPRMIPKREERAGHTRLTVPLGTAHLWFASLKVQSSEPVFSRRVKVIADDRTLASETLFRVALDGHEASTLEIPVHTQIQAAELVIDIENNDSPPLKIDGVEAGRCPVVMAFHADAAGHWQLYSGNPAAHAPSYDMATLSEQLRSTAAASAQVSALVPNPAFNKTAALPETGAAGAAIDLKGWAYRRPLVTGERGVVQVELDIGAQAHASPGFADLRLVQSGHQLPYLLRQTSKTREVPVRFTPVPDPQHPSVSRWELKLPVAGLPFTALSATSSTPLFTRHLSLSESRRDSYGNRSTTFFGSASWSQKPAATQPLSMPVNMRPQGDTLMLETDNGDNAPLQLDTVSVSHPVVQLLFKTTDPAPVLLYYGNSQAAAPSYDLNLVEAELRAATPALSALGAEEQLKPSTLSVADSGKGSPWLWAVLALVVGGLLWLVAKLLPQSQA